MRASAAALPRPRVRVPRFRPPSEWIAWCIVWFAIIGNWIFRDAMKVASGHFSVGDLLDLGLQMFLFTLVWYLYQRERAEEKRRKDDDALRPPPGKVLWGLAFFNVAYAAAAWIPGVS